MELYTIQTKLFGEIKITNAGGLYDYYDVILNGSKMKVLLSIEIDDEGDFVDNDDVIIIENILNHIPDMYKKAKSTISDEMDSNEVIKSFIEYYFDEYDIEPPEECFKIFGVNSIAELSKEAFAEKLEPRMIFVERSTERYSNSNIHCCFDFSLPKEFSDQLLVVCFNAKYEIYDIAWES